jgi:flagellar biosynthetic protein FliO
MESEYLHFGLNLLLVLALMIGLAFLLKKIKQVKYSGSNQIKIVNAVSIGAKEKIVLLEVNGSTLLIGATANQITTLHRFNELELLEAKLDGEPAFKKEMMNIMEHEGT